MGFTNVIYLGLYSQQGTKQKKSARKWFEALIYEHKVPRCTFSLAYLDVVVGQALVQDGHLVALDGAVLEVVVVLHQELLLALEELVDVALRRVQHQLVARLRERGEHAWD